jgi:hypothetical protein
MFLLLQQLEPTVDFWPTTADGWLSIAGVVSTALLAIATLLIRQARHQARTDDRVSAIEALLTEKFQEQGRRIGGNETDVASVKASIEELRRTDLQHTLQLDTNTREVTRAQSDTQSLNIIVQEHLKEAGKIEVRVRERMARIEERLKLPVTKES